jgi:FkbM family methyltransferase
MLGSAEGLKWNRKEIPVLEEVMTLVPARRVAVQAGGNLGVFPKVMSRWFETVYTFEPDPELFEMMSRNAPERNVVKFQAALGCERGTVGVSRERRQKDGGSSHEGIAHVSGKGVIPTLRVDDLGLRTCDLLYLDIEGYELYALRGAVETVDRCKPVVACEVNKSLEQMGGITREDIHAWFRLHDYDFLRRVRSDEIFIPRGKQ